MKPEGWVFMILSVGAVISLITWCFAKVLSGPAAIDHMHAPLEIDTQDRDT
jgi:hypothetical protein